MEERASGGAAVIGLTYGVFVVLGVVIGVIGSFEFSWTAGGFPYAAILLSLVNFGAFWLAGWAMRAKLGAVAVFVPWMIVVAVLSMQRPEGDLVVTGTTSGYLFIFGGAVEGIAAISLTRSSRPWLPRDEPVAEIRKTRR